MWRIGPIFIIAASVLISGCDNQPSKKTSVQENTANRSVETSAVASLELQRMCSDQADKAFKAEGYQQKQNIVNSYLNHYNAKLRKCFILFNIYDASEIATSGTVSTIEELEDAFEGTIYGQYFASTDTTASVPEEHLPICQMTPMGKKLQTCRSEEQWKAHVATFMESD